MSSVSRGVRQFSAGDTAGVRLTEFWRLMADQFGSSYAPSVAQDHVLYGLGGLTVSQALDRGDDPKRVWQVVCDEFEVPANRR